MANWYRRSQLISTVVMLFPSAALLALAYSCWTSGRQRSRAEAVVYFLLGVALPPLIYFAWTAIIWMKRGALPGADPSSLAARVAKKPLLVLSVMGGLAIGLVSFLNGFADTVTERDDNKQNGYARMRASCVSGMSAALKQKGVDPNASPMKEKVDKYCGCVVVRLRTEYTLDEVEKLLEQGLVMKEPKARELNAKCLQQVNWH
jgi:hypothetical protein